MDKRILVVNFFLVTALFFILAVCGGILSWKFYFFSYVLFFMTYYLFHTLVKKYSLRINNLSKAKFCSEIALVIFLGSYLVYIVNAIVLEGIAFMTGNFWDGLSCRGPGCVALLALVLYIPYLIFVILDAILFTIFFGATTELTGKEMKGFFSPGFFYFRAVSYPVLGFLLLGAVLFFLMNIRM